MHIEKCITIQVFLVNFRPSSGYCRKQILWSFKGLHPQDSARAHVPDQEKNQVPLGAPSIRLPPQQPHSHYVTDLSQGTSVANLSFVPFQTIIHISRSRSAEIVLKCLCRSCFITSSKLDLYFLKSSYGNLKSASLIASVYQI